jgi:hypothetical protein
MIKKVVFIGQVGIFKNNNFIFREIIRGVLLQIKIIKILQQQKFRYSLAII